MLSFLTLKSNSVTIGLNFLLDPYLLSYHQALLTLFFSMLDYSLLKFDRRHQLFVNNQYVFLDFFIL